MEKKIYHKTLKAFNTDTEALSLSVLKYHITNAICIWIASIKEAIKNVYTHCMLFVSH